MGSSGIIRVHGPEASRPLNSLNVPLPPSPVCISPPPVEKKKNIKENGRNEIDIPRRIQAEPERVDDASAGRRGPREAETPEKDAIEMKEKASTTSEGEKDDSNPEKTEG